MNVSVLAQQLSLLRKEANLTLQQLGLRCGISASALSKIENGKLSPTYEKIMALAKGLNVDVGSLFGTDMPSASMSRRSITLRSEGIKHITEQYEYEVLCADITDKRFVPLITTVKARSVQDFPTLIHHEGEEFIYVLEGKLTVHTDHYRPMELEVGDSCYFDSTMGHVCISSGDVDARIIWICSSPRLEDNYVSKTMTTSRSGSKKNKE